MSKTPLSKQYDEILGYFYSAEEDKDYCQNVRPKIQELEAENAALKQEVAIFKARAYAADALNAENADLMWHGWLNYICNRCDAWDDAADALQEYTRRIMVAEQEASHE